MEEDIIALANYDNEPKVSCLYSAEELSLFESMGHPPLMFLQHIIKCPVVAISPFFNLLSMTGRRDDRDIRYIQGLIYSSPNYTSDDPRCCNISKAFLDGVLADCASQNGKHLEHVDLNVPLVDKIKFKAKRCRIHEIIDCLHCFRHARFNHEMEWCTIPLLISRSTSWCNRSSRIPTQHGAALTRM